MKKLDDQQVRDLFRALNNPGSATRQLADWKRADPSNPPPLVAKAIEEMQKVGKSAMDSIPPEMLKGLAEGD